eukprot:scaffold278009_cov17-Prasinocladus_malaysianus.AAC.1
MPYENGRWEHRQILEVFVPLAYMRNQWKSTYYRSRRQHVNLFQKIDLVTIHHKPFQTTRDNLALIRFMTSFVRFRRDLRLCVQNKSFRYHSYSNRSAARQQSTPARFPIIQSKASRATETPRAI